MTFIEPALEIPPPPRPLIASLSLIVLFVMVMDPLLKIPPPPPEPPPSKELSLMLRLIVLFVILAVPVFVIPPPLAAKVNASLLLIVLFVMLSFPLLLVNTSTYGKAGSVGGDCAVYDVQSTRVFYAPSLNTGDRCTNKRREDRKSTGNGETGQRQVSLRGDRNHPPPFGSRWSASVATDNRSFRPLAYNCERERPHNAYGLCHVFTGFQKNRILLAVVIGFIDGGDKAGSVRSWAEKLPAMNGGDCA